MPLAPRQYRKHKRCITVDNCSISSIDDDEETSGFDNPCIHCVWWYEKYIEFWVASRLPLMFAEKLIVRSENC
jgi:hypothetical protein